MLDVFHVTKRYGKTVACADVSFHLDPGSVTVLLGPNGAGKSTIMKAIIGFLRYEGEITVDGLPSKTEAARRRLGYIPELPSLYPNLTVSEHMEFLARAYRLTERGGAGVTDFQGQPTEYQTRIAALFDRFELTEQRGKFGDELSKGMQQKLNLCLGLLPDPDVCLLDEPMIGLDPHAIKELKRMIEEMRGLGKTLLISTHIIDSVDMRWDRAMIMQNGEIRANLTREELGERTLEDVFFTVTEGLERDSMREGGPEA